MSEDVFPTAAEVAGRLGERARPVTSRDAAVDVFLSMRRAGQFLQESTLAGTCERVAVDKVLRAIDDGILAVRLRELR